MTPDAVRDRAGRFYPAHLDVRHGDQDWWHGVERYSRDRPRYTFDRDRSYRDRNWRARGIPPDHRRPRPGDDLAVWASVRKVLARLAADERRAALLAERRRRGIPPDDVPDPVCTRPPGCDELLFPDEPLGPRQRAVPHVDGCPCRCDIA